MTTFRKIVLLIGALIIAITLLLFVWLIKPSGTSVIAVLFSVFAEILLTLSTLILFDNKKYEGELLIKSGISTLGVIYLTTTLVIMFVHNMFGGTIDILLTEIIIALVFSVISVTLVGFYKHDRKVKIKDSETSKTNSPKQGKI